jgi:hypothetical protein
MAAGIGTASAQSGRSGEGVPAVVSTCLLPLLPCDDQPSGGGGSWESTPADSWSNAPVPDDSWSSAPVPGDSWSSAPGIAEPERPWRPAGEDERKVPKGHPETGGGGLAQDAAVWPFTVGGVALLAGGGLAGFAVRRRKDVA